MNLSHVVTRIAAWCGSVAAVVVSIMVTLVWVVAGPFMGFSEQWLLLMGTWSAIVTTIMAFIIQNAQSRGDAALHAKLDALIGYLDVPNKFIRLDQEDLEVIVAAREDLRD